GFELDIHSVVVAVVVADIAATDGLVAHFHTHADVTALGLENGIHFGIDGLAVVLTSGAAQVVADITVGGRSIPIADPRRKRNPIGQLTPIADGSQYRLHHLA